MQNRPARVSLPPAALRPMTEQDLPAVLAVQAACYPPAMQEPGEVVSARLRAAPGTALVALDAAGVCAYVFAYPCMRGSITPLNANFSPAPDADTLYVHDLAVHPRAQGQGRARLLAQALFDAAPARGLRHAALVAVPDARAFWERLGFETGDPGEGREALATYPGGAAYLCRRIDA